MRITTVLLSFLYAEYQCQEFYRLATNYSKNIPPSKYTGKEMEVLISLFINRVSAVDESKEEISLDVFLQLYWTDERITIDNTSLTDQVELTWARDHSFWTPDLYIRQLREMRILSLFQDMASVRLYKNSTLRVSTGATVIIKCDMDFSLYPLDVQTCNVDFSSYKYTVADMHFRWKDDPPLSFPSDFGDGYRLPRYVVSFTTEKANHTIYYGEGNHIPFVVPHPASLSKPHNLLRRR
uniref:Glycine receptor subunit alpha-4 n=1 Tax=Cacopsylla melanoneura TaxID=428564 RepID=A0A8D9BU56_9HEMI